MQSNHFSWTLFNFEDVIDDIRQWVDTIDTICYTCFGIEKCPQTNRWHLQGYSQCVSRTRWSTFKTRVGLESLHISASRGSDEDNREYCSKSQEQEGCSFEEYGNRNTIGRRKKTADDNWSSILEMIKTGGSVADIASEFPKEFARSHAGIEKMIKIFCRKSPTIYYGPFSFYIQADWRFAQVLVGPTGIGKSQYAKTIVDNPLMIRHVDKLKMFNPRYHGGIIFDDMCFTHWPRESQIHVCDVADDSDINVKHSYVTIPANTKLIFTCNRESFPFIKDAAILRRLMVWTFKQTPTFPLGQFYLQ